MKSIHPPHPCVFGDLKAAGWQSKSIKQEIHDNLLDRLAAGDTLFPGLVGYEDTVIPELCTALLAKHDILFMGEKGQAKSRLMRQLADLLDPYIPYIAGSELHEDPFQPITRYGIERIAREGDETPIEWWPRSERYVERLAPGTKFADVIGEIDPGKLAAGTSLSAEESLHFGLIPRMNRGIFAMNEVPELDELVQVGMFNILEERDVQVRGYPVRFDLDIFILFSANPATYNRSGKVIPQLKDRIGSIIRTHYPRERHYGVEIMEQEAGACDEGRFPVRVPLFMKEICEQITIELRRSPYVDHRSGVSARFSIANYRSMVAAARRRCAVLGEAHAIPRISDLGHLHASSMGKLEIDLMSSHQMSEDQILEAAQLEAIKTVFEEYADKHGLEEIADVFGKGVQVQVGSMLPSAEYAERLKRVPPAWEKAFEINPADDPAMRASCVEFVLAGLYAGEKISRTQRHGTITYET
ncbi:MAG TPA: magnesium chelatase [Phycisphaerae bacterium]|nr:magnesium chelatase [Phycisphaerae bacterium]